MVNFYGYEVENYKGLEIWKGFLGKGVYSVDYEGEEYAFETLEDAKRAIDGLLA